MRIAFYKGTQSGLYGFLDKLVRWWTGGPYSHCEIILHGDDAAAICASASKTDGGVRIKTIALDPSRWAVVEIGGDSARAAEWFAAHLGEGYDLLGLFGFVWRRRDGERNKWFCSEACAAALGLAEPWRYCPNALASLLRGRLPLPSGNMF